MFFPGQTQFEALSLRTGKNRAQQRTGGNIPLFSIKNLLSVQGGKSDPAKQGKFPLFCGEGALRHAGHPPGDRRWKSWKDRRAMQAQVSAGVLFFVREEKHDRERIRRLGTGLPPQLPHGSGCREQGSGGRECRPSVSSRRGPCAAVCASGHGTAEDRPGDESSRPEETAGRDSLAR